MYRIEQWKSNKIIYHNWSNREINLHPIWKYSTQSTRTRELFFKTQGAIEYLEAVGITLPEPEVTEEAEAPTEEAPAEEG